MRSHAKPLAVWFFLGWAAIVPLGCSDNAPTRPEARKVAMPEEPIPVGQPETLPARPETAKVESAKVEPAKTPARPEAAAMTKPAADEGPKLISGAPATQKIRTQRQRSGRAAEKNHTAKTDMTSPKYGRRAADSTRHAVWQSGQGCGQDEPRCQPDQLPGAAG